jgi:hypothetical protein
VIDALKGSTSLIPCLVLPGSRYLRLIIILEAVAVLEGIKHEGGLGHLVPQVVDHEDLAKRAMATIGVCEELEALKAIRLLKLEAHSVF